MLCVKMLSTRGLKQLAEEPPVVGLYYAKKLQNFTQLPFLSFVNKLNTKGYLKHQNFSFKSERGWEQAHVYQKYTIPTFLLPKRCQVSADF